MSKCDIKPNQVMVSLNKLIDNYVIDDRVSAEAIWMKEIKSSFILAF